VLLFSGDAGSGGGGRGSGRVREVTLLLEHFLIVKGNCMKIFL
jgi:hypothetical protein